MKTHINVQKKETIIKIKRVFDDVRNLLIRYGNKAPQLKEYLSSHFTRLERQMRHIPDYQRKVMEEDFVHLSINRLTVLEKELNNIHRAILNMTGEVSPERRDKYFNVISALKQYDKVKLNFDTLMNDGQCNKNNLKELETEFNKKWDELRFLFLTDPKFKQRLKYKKFDGISDNKLEKTSKIFNQLSRKLISHIDTNCH